MPEAPSAAAGEGRVVDTVGGRIATVDVSNYEIMGAIREPGCALCRVELLAERRLVQSFLREGRHSPGAREAFMRAGGFCRRHAWQLHHEADDEGTGAGIADVYKQLVSRDLAWLDETAAKVGKRRGRRFVRRHFRRRAHCPLCVALAGSRRSHAFFLGQLIRDERAREALAGGDGLCFPHLEIAVRESLRSDRTGRASGFLVRDWRRRVESLGRQLSEYDRKRDYRYAHERRGEEQHSWTEVIRRYVGGTPADGLARGGRRPSEPRARSVREGGESS